jgi:hypothetical protein
MRREGRVVMRRECRVVMRRKGRVVMRREGRRVVMRREGRVDCVVMRREDRVVMRREGRVVMRRDGQWVRRLLRRLADGIQARGSLRAARPGEGPWIRDRMRWEHRATRFGEEAAPRGVDSAQRSVGGQAGYGWSRARSRRRGVGGKPGVKQWSGRPRERTGRE